MDYSAILKNILQLISGLISNGTSPDVKIDIPLGENNKEISEPSTIDWLSPDCPVTKHFNVKDACMLHSWNRLAGELDGFNDEMKQKIIKTCQMMEKIRDILQCPINVHCMFRSQQYNKEVVHAIPNDVHAQGLACDWDASPHYTIEEAKEKIRPQLSELNIRMEAGTITWIHNDWHSVGPSGREFKA